MIRLALVGLLAAMAVVAVAAWWVRPLSVARGIGRLDASEGERLLSVLRAAAIPAAQVRLVDTVSASCIHERSHILARWLRLDRATRSHCVGVRDGRVLSLSLSSAALRELAPLAHLASLRYVELRNGHVERIGRLRPDCLWETLHVGHSQLRDLDGLEVCTRLTSLDVSHNRLRTLSVEALTDLESLDASGNAINDLTPLSGLDRLTDLTLRDLPLTDASSIPPLPALRRLELSRTGIERLDADTLARWPQLRWLGLAETPLDEIASPYEIEGALTYPVLRLGSGLKIGVNETPLAEWVQAEAVAAHDGMTVHRVEELPRGSGRWQGTKRRSRTRTGLRSELDVSGSAQWMTGAHAIAFDIDRGLSVTVSASIDKGRVRMYLRDGEDYVYAEAIPRRPLTLRGSLITGTEHYVVFVEAVDGRVEGLRWRVSS